MAPLSKKTQRAICAQLKDMIHEFTEDTEDLPEKLEEDTDQCSDIAIRTLEAIYNIHTLVEPDGSVVFTGAGAQMNIYRAAEGKSPAAREIQELMRAAEKEAKSKSYLTCK